jgi:SAM-dependent methyltransferase
MTSQNETPVYKGDFSKLSGIYLKYRPHYPPELFEYLQTLTEGHELAWDCGTGNGQAAVGLAGHYEKVYATDPGAEQLKHAMPHSRIVYKQERAEHCSLPDSSADLLTVAQALHWFDFDRFYAVAKRVLKPGGVIAAWAYGLPSLPEEVDGVFKHFHDEVVSKYWLYENLLIYKEYEPIPFPFQQIGAPAFSIIKEMDLQSLVGLARSWSATQTFIDRNHTDPTTALQQQLAAVWGDPASKKQATWKLILKLGRNS